MPSLCGVICAFASFAGCGEEARRDIAKQALSHALSSFKVDKGFHIVDGKPVYVDSNANEGKITRDLPAVDSVTFRILTQPRDARALFAADTTHVFMAMSYHVHKLTDADGASFELLTPDGNFSRDSRHVFFLGVVLDGADPATFKVLTYPFGKDAQHAFVGTIPIPVQDLASWGPLQQGQAENPWYASAHDTHPQSHTKLSASGWSRDLTGMYYGEKRILSADPKTFQLMSDYYSKDSNNVFFGDKPIPNADAATFAVYDGPYIRGTKIYMGAGPEAHDALREYRSGKVHSK